MLFVLIIDGVLQYLHKNDLPVSSQAVSTHLKTVVLVGPEQELLKGPSLWSALKSIKPRIWLQLREEEIMIFVDILGKSHTHYMHVTSLEYHEM